MKTSIKHLNAFPDVDHKSATRFQLGLILYDILINSLLLFTKGIW